MSKRATTEKKIYLKPISPTKLVDGNGTEYKCPKDATSKERVSRAFQEGDRAVKIMDKDGVLTMGTVDMKYFEESDNWYKGSPWEQLDSLKIHKAPQGVALPTEQVELMKFVETSESLKPSKLFMKGLKWKFLVRSAMRGKNILMTGPAGCGKTMAAQTLTNCLGRENFYFNLGATQDPRATLIGNTHFNKEKGTYFSKALFVEAIQTPNAVILLDELSRAHPDAWNILMTVLDAGQRYLRLDEASNQTTIKVAEGVTFIATANIGNEYTSTRVMDKALMDRFTVIEMDLLSKGEEADLLKYMFPLVEYKKLESIAEIAEMTRKECNTEESRLNSPVSTRTSVELASLIFDGFTLDEAAQITVYPQYSTDGGVDSERTFVKQIVQKFCDDGTEEDLFNVDDMQGDSI